MEKDSSAWFFERKEGLILRVNVKPNSKKNGITLSPDRSSLIVRLRSPAREGKANKELVEFLANELGVAVSSIEIYKGEKSKHKLIFVRGKNLKEIKLKF